MAVDTFEKRLSVLDFGRPGWCLPVADGSFDQADRQHLLGLYADISAHPAVKSYVDGATLSGTGLRSATLVGTGLRSATFVGTGLKSATLRPRTA